jgi:hypothetical protein
MRQPVRQFRSSAARIGLRVTGTSPACGGSAARPIARESTTGSGRSQAVARLPQCAAGVDRTSVA